MKIDNVKNFILNTNVSLILITIFTIRLVAYGANIGEAIALLGFAGLYGYTLYLKSKHVEPLEEKVKKELEEIKNVITALKLQNAVKGSSNEQKTRFF